MKNIKDFMVEKTFRMKIGVLTTAVSLATRLLNKINGSTVLYKEEIRNRIYKI